MKMKNEEFLKGAGVLMILGGIIAVIGGMVMLFTAASITADTPSSILSAAALMSIACGIAAGAAGYAGVRHSVTDENLNDCMAWAAVVSAMGLVSSIMAGIATASPYVVSIVLSVIIPALYIMAAHDDAQLVSAPLPTAAK